MLLRLQQVSAGPGPEAEVRFKVEMSEQMSSGYWTYKESQSSASITLTKLGAGKVYYVRITPFNIILKD